MLQLADRRTNRIVKIDLEFLTHNLQWRYRLFTKMHYQCMFCDKISPGVHFHTLFEGLRMVTLVYYKQKIRKMQNRGEREKRRRGKQSSHRVVQIGRFLLPQHGFIFQT